MLEIAFVSAVIIGMVEAFKRSKLLSSRFSPLVAITLGIVFMYFGSDGDTFNRIIEGVIAGLTASGLYSGTKATLK